MRIIYSTGIVLYGLLIRLAALFNGKAKLWVDGRKGLWSKLTSELEGIDREKNPVTWFHVSSLGEFEQGRPVIEAIKERWPGRKIILTFFSPSGFEVRKNYEHADFVFYLPPDTPGNARKFLDLVNPEMVFFVKYDFWFNYMSAIHKRRIPLYFISVLFRPEQYFFKWYGGWFRKHLGMVSRFFVQNQASEELLQTAGIKQVMLTGDTRFDRVFAIAARSAPIPLVEQFCAGKPLFIAGSCWPPDEAVFLPLIKSMGNGMKFIIAPHDTSPHRIREIKDQLPQPVVCFSELNERNSATMDILLIDSVGILSRLYRYATVAFIGGGFGSGLHNIQEPVTFGVPVIFGPDYRKFSEACDLVELGGAFSVRSADELSNRVGLIIGSRTEQQRLYEICKKYVDEKRGATDKIIRYIEGTF